MTPPFKKSTRKQPPKPWANRKFTKAEKQLLDHPPTPRTWVCTRKREKGEQGRVPCGFVNSGGQRKCVMCGSPKPQKPKLLWPLYLAACKKAGVTPKGVSE